LKEILLCRNSAPLLKLCLEFLHEGKEAYVKGTDLGEDLIRLIVKSTAKSTADLKIWSDTEIKKLIIAIKKQYTLF
jgi:hypothetical protein